MNDPGLRERKKQRMFQTLSDVAIGLFLERGFDAVSVAEVAAAAEVSKPTLFRYFPAKEDLVLHRVAADPDAPRLRDALAAAGIPAAGPGEPGARVAVVPASVVKGLEYDHVVAVEPAAIVEAEGPGGRGLHRLYVVLTRAVSRLDVVHARPLPF